MLSRRVIYRKIETESSIRLATSSHNFKMSNKLSGDEKSNFDKWTIPATKYSKLTLNKIRDIAEYMKYDPKTNKELIRLSVGDPTIFGNFKTSDVVTEAVKESLLSKKFNGYGLTNGILSARQAIAEYSAHQGNVTAEDVILCNGCSSALEFCITTLVERGENILCPKPGFPNYQTLVLGIGINIKYYRLIPERNWEIDLINMESLIDNKTRAILITNPSNPCGNVFSKDHILKVIEIAEKHLLPIIADEIYEKMVFPGVEYTPVSSVSKNVPVLTCSGLTKRFLVPGWRIGWIVVHDRYNIFEREVKKGLLNQGGKLLSCNTIIQGAMPKILRDTPLSFFEETNRIFAKHAEAFFEVLKNIPGLNPIMPQGAMYMMVEINIEKFRGIADDMDFVWKLVEEQNVLCLPGKCFECPNFFRIVITIPFDKIREVGERISEFCNKYYHEGNFDINSI